MKTTKLHRILALALALGMLMTAPASAAGLLGWLFGDDDEEAVEASATVALTVDATPAPEAAAEPDATPFIPPQIPDCQLRDDGMLRVFLRSLGAPEQLNLTFAGVYAVDGDPGFRFERGTRACLSAADGCVYLSVGGLTINLGGSAVFTRHRAADGAENGIYIDESEKNALYCGDLTVSADANGGLRAVLKIQVEDYLYGVVAYEMSDSFPIEALKAQAVAARTYAMQRKSKSAGRDYDLVDTTADQVYKGFDAQYANVIAAVDATRGVVGLHGGSYAICYYTASNGGQTALASQIWGSADNDGYLAMKDDPYDLENPRSLQNELTVSARCEGSASLKAMLEAALGEQLAAEGYGDGEWQLDSIESIEPVNPRFEGSRMYEGLRFTLRAKLLKPLATAAPLATTEPGATPEADGMPLAPEAVEKEWVLSDGTWDVTLDVYGQIKGALALGLNGSDYELISVETARDESGAAQSFTIIMRRYGHGVGMSQRGAQWMAGHYGKGWQEILAFYYPGMSVERMSWPEFELTDLAALPAGVGAARPKPTPAPTPAPLPALQSGEYYAKVTADLLNVRERPTTSSPAIDQLARGRRVIVCGEADGDGWVPIKTAELSGYVKLEYLKRE